MNYLKLAPFKKRKKKIPEQVTELTTNSKMSLFLSIIVRFSAARILVNSQKDARFYLVLISSILLLAYDQGVYFWV